MWFFESFSWNLKICSGFIRSWKSQHNQTAPIVEYPLHLKKSWRVEFILFTSFISDNGWKYCYKKCFIFGTYFMMNWAGVDLKWNTQKRRIVVWKTRKIGALWFMRYGGFYWLYRHCCSYKLELWTVKKYDRNLVRKFYCGNFIEKWIKL